MDKYDKMISSESLAKLRYIPTNPHDKEVLRAVDSKTITEVHDHYGIFIDYEWFCNTIADVMVETIIKQLAYLLKNNPGMGNGIDFYEIFRSIISIKKNEKAEKEGNINIYFEPGAKILELIEDPTKGESILPTFQELSGDNQDDYDFYKNLDSQCRYQLTMHNGIMFPESLKFACCAVTITFMKNIFMELMYRVANNPEKDTSDEVIESVNFNDLIEIHAILKGDKVSISMRPGVNAKLLIKCDELTEHTMGDLY